MEVISEFGPTVNLEYIHPDAEQTIVKLARVSNPENQLNSAYKGLIRYLLNHKHWSPFEMVDMCVEIYTTRDIAQQILRHRSFSFQEFSSRYSSLEGLCKPELRVQAEKNRQSSTERHTDTSLEQLVDDYLDYSLEVYQQLLDKGVARECARSILPLCSRTRMYMKGSIRSWIHYYQLRSKPDTQLEHRAVAEQVGLIMKEHLPTVWEVIHE